LPTPQKASSSAPPPTDIRLLSCCPQQETQECRRRQGFKRLPGGLNVAAKMTRHGRPHVIARRRSRRGNPEVLFFAWLV
jgi:hypothetical protein